MLLLSEAIRLGGILHPQVRGAFFITEQQEAYDVFACRHISRGFVVGTCALGGALEAIGITELSEEENTGFMRSIDGVPEEWITLLAHYGCEVSTHSGLPFTPIADATIEDIIKFLNDSPFHWTREQIAAWVESVEDQPAPEPALHPLTSSMRISPKEDPLLVPASSAT